MPNINGNENRIGNIIEIAITTMDRPFIPTQKIIKNIGQSPNRKKG